MAKDSEWAASSLKKTQESNKSIPESVSSRLAKALTGELSERHLPQAELVKLATALIKDMVPATGAKGSSS